MSSHAPSAYNVGSGSLSHNIQMDLLACLSWDSCKDRLLKSGVYTLKITEDCTEEVTERSIRPE